jgi:hypothetical protein
VSNFAAHSLGGRWARVACRAPCPTRGRHRLEINRPNAATATAAVFILPAAAAAGLFTDLISGVCLSVIAIALYDDALMSYFDKRRHRSRYGENRRSDNIMYERSQRFHFGRRFHAGIFQRCHHLCAYADEMGHRNFSILLLPRLPQWK